jgi:predicted dithiol-disulfide oxidoreductase (DUF899 family)
MTDHTTRRRETMPDHKTGTREEWLAARRELWGMYQWLDRAPRGRNETDLWYRRHDEYDSR